MSRALVIVDIQRDYFPGGNMPLHEPEAAAAKAGQVLEAFRAAGDPVVHVQHLSPAGAGFLEEGPTARDHGAGHAAGRRDAHHQARAQLVPGHRPRAAPAQPRRRRGRRDGDDDEHVRRRDHASRRRPRLQDDARSRRLRRPDLEFGGRQVAAQDVHASFVAALGQAYATVTPADELT
jgi:nicotinamidase-related amidase